VALIRECASLVRAINYRTVGVDIKEHIAQNRERIKRIARRYAGWDENEDDVEQAIILLMIERHKSPSYDHSKAELLTYAQRGLKDVIFREIDQYKHITDNTVVVPPSDVDAEGISSLEDLEQMGRVTAINWHRAGYGEQPSTLTPDELELAQKLTANLTDEELEILDASVGRSERKASEYLGMSKSTYRYRLRRARDKAQTLARLVAA